MKLLRSAKGQDAVETHGERPQRAENATAFGVRWQSPAGTVTPLWLEPWQDVAHRRDRKRRRRRFAALPPHSKGQAAAEAFSSLAECRETRQPLECGVKPRRSRGAHAAFACRPPPVSSLAKNLGEAHPRPIRLVAVVELVPLPILTGRSSAPKKRSLWSAVAESRRDGDTALDGGPRVLECVAPLRVGWHVYKMLRTGAIESGVGAASRLCRRTPKAVAFRGVPPNWRMPPIPTGGPVAATLRPKSYDL